MGKVIGYWFIVIREKIKRTNGATPYQPSPTGWVTDDSPRKTFAPHAWASEKSSRSNRDEKLSVNGYW
jgi:hypothetical protein